MASKDFLNIALGSGFIVLVIFLSILIFYGILILRDFSQVSKRSKDVAEKVHHLVLEPINALAGVVEKIKPIIDLMRDKHHRDRDDEDDE